MSRELFCHVRCVGREEYDALKAERDELKWLHRQATAHVVPGEVDTSDAYLKILNELKAELANLKLTGRKINPTILERDRLQAERAELKAKAYEQAATIQSMYETNMELKDANASLAHHGFIAVEKNAEIERLKAENARLHKINPDVIDLKRERDALRKQLAVARAYAFDNAPDNASYQQLLDELAALDSGAQGDE